MTNELDSLLCQIEGYWRERFAAEFGAQFQDAIVDAGTAISYCCLHFGLCKPQVKLLVRYWQKMGFIQLTKRGWKLFKFAEPMQMEEVHIK